MIQIKRAYEKPDRTDGVRILVDRLCPRGLTKEALHIDEWVKDLGPSNALRQWFGHRPERWQGFLSKYFKELDKKQVYWEPILKKSKRGHMTLVYGAKDTQYNNAAALKQYLSSKT